MVILPLTLLLLSIQLDVNTVGITTFKSCVAESHKSFIPVNSVSLGVKSREVDSQRPISATLESYGAKGDGKTDDTEAITKALNSPIEIIYSGKKGGNYRISNLIVVSNVHKKKLIASGAKFLNIDSTKASFLFEKCSNIEVRGGTFGYTKRPSVNGNNSQHVLQFESCVKVMVDKIHIINSPEMGVAITNSNFVTVQHSLIENTFRDGTYAHYSSNVKYLYNRYKNIKDDAMSFHDYGINLEKTQLKKYGYKSASNILALGNIVQNAYQGFASVGSQNITVSRNKFYNIVLAGVSLVNSMELRPGGMSSVKNAVISKNVLNNVCASPVIIMGRKYDNNGQASTGRAAIFIGSLGARSQLFMGETKRLTNVRVESNIINKCGANGFWSNLSDNLSLVDNKFYNCSGKSPEHSLAGNVIEINNTTGFKGYNNSIIDNRAKKLHEYGYVLEDVSGKMSKWNVQGTRKGEKLLRNSQSLLQLKN